MTDIETIRRIRQNRLYEVDRKAYRQVVNNTFAALVTVVIMIGAYVLACGLADHLQH
jgi:hypothetical protein